MSLKAFQPYTWSNVHVQDTKLPLLTPQELGATGRALFGAGWRAELACTFSVAEEEIVRVESGRAPAPREWRAQLIALAQDVALRALEAANNLLWRESQKTEDNVQALFSPEPPRMA